MIRYICMYTVSDRNNCTQDKFHGAYFRELSINICRIYHTVKQRHNGNISFFIKIPINLGLWTNIVKELFVVLEIHFLKSSQNSFLTDVKYWKIPMPWVWILGHEWTIFLCILRSPWRQNIPKVLIGQCLMTHVKLKNKPKTPLNFLVWIIWSLTLL